MMCFRETPVAKHFMVKRGEAVSRFSVESFCLTVPKKLVKEPFCAVFQNFSVSEKDYG